MHKLNSELPLVFRMVTSPTNQRIFSMKSSCSQITVPIRRGRPNILQKGKTQESSSHSCHRIRERCWKHIFFFLRELYCCSCDSKNEKKSWNPWLKECLRINQTCRIMTEHKRIGQCRRECEKCGCASIERTPKYSFLTNWTEWISHSEWNLKDFAFTQSARLD